MLNAPTLPDLDDASVHWVEDVLRYADLDPNRHVNNVAFAALAEAGRVRFVLDRLPPLDGALVVLARLAIDFRAELLFPGRVRTATWVGRVGRTSFTFGQAIVGDDGLAATVEAVCVTLDPETRRAAPPPDAVRAALERLSLTGAR
ncbi:MAG: acyl-CoA thioesterase [Rhodobacteraceae bacterium]|nr:MAG: acyl-CoA thioesterase [Paracoccaceae bacterium]